MRQRESPGVEQSSDTEDDWFWLRSAFRLLAVLMAGAHTWAAATRHSMNPDGVNYLDIGDAYFRGDWDAVINTVWSPLYSWIIGGALWLVQPSMRWEFPLVHGVNFVIFLGALAAFEFMWRQLAKSRSTDAVSRQTWETWPAWAWWALGYLLFLWATLSLIQIWAVTPDMLMAALVFCAAGLVARIRSGQDGWREFALLGCVLGVGYLSKSIMAPISLLFLGAGFVAVTDTRRAVPRIMLALLVWLLVGGPFVLLMTNAKGSFTYGEAGKLTYVRHVNHVAYPHWQGIPAGDGMPAHPSRQVFDNPPIYEFGSPVGGTYPIAYDQTYWYEGVIVRFDLTNQVRQLIHSALFYADLLVRQQGAILFSLLLIFALRGWQRVSWLAMGRGSLLSLVGLSTLLLYAPILVAGSYVGAFMVILWSDVLAQARLPYTPIARRIFQSLSVIMAGFLLVNLALFNLQGFSTFTENGGQHVADQAAAPPPAWPGQVAEELRRLGVGPGDGVAVIGYGFDSYWARLARTKIVAEMLEWQATPFWYGDAAFQAEVLTAFATTDARAVVAEYVPAHANLPGWHQVGETNFFIYLLNRPE